MIREALAFVAALGLIFGVVNLGAAGAGATPASAGQRSVRTTESVGRDVGAKRLGSGGSVSGWSIQNTPDATVTNGILNADDCDRPAFCMAVGSFADRSGTSALAESWNGKAWGILSVPTSPGGSESALQGVSCSSPSACVAVGHYLDTSGVEATLAEAWNGTSWSVQSTPNPDGATSSVMESVSCGSTVSCVGVGYFLRTKRVQGRLAERWNGTDWTLQKTANPVDDAGSVFDGVSCAATNSCMAVGYYLDSDRWVTLAEEWNGDDWNVVVTPNPTRSIVASLYGVSCSTPTSCTAVGDSVRSSGKLLASTLAEAWNGSAWTIEATPNPGGTVIIDTLKSVRCSSASSCVAVGYCNHAARGGAQTLAESWNGTDWTIQGTANPGRYDSALYGLSCNGNRNCTAVGDYRNQAGTYLTLTEVSNGGTWRVRTSPVPNAAVSSVLESISCNSPTACTAVGSYANSPKTRMTLAEQWNGIAWRIQATPNPADAKNNVLESVSCSTPTACTAVGESSNRSGSFTLAETWNGVSWAIESTPNPSGKGAKLSAVSCSSATSCIAVGYYLSDLDLSETLAEVWNGTDWTIQDTPNPSGNDSPVLQGVSCSSDTACTAVGNYTSDASLVALAERWNGTDWTIQSTPTGDDDLYGVSCSSASSCTAVGDSYGYPSGIAPLAEAWNGEVWSDENAVGPVSYFSSFYGVSCRSASACTAVGGYDDSSAVAETLAETWNGTRWKIQSTPAQDRGTNSFLDSVSDPSVSDSSVSDPSGNVLFAVGSHVNRAEVSVTLGEVEHN